MTPVAQNTGKAVDVEVMTTVSYGNNNNNDNKRTKHGLEYEEWTESHMEDFSFNHEGSAGMMDVTRMKEFLQDQNRDAKTFSAVDASKSYEDYLSPQKVECTGHGNVQIGMGSQLRELKKK
ncbi:hypothetical protein FOCC_FOCC016557 [Frankliniella occidentalis]|nr:hypothetical protein FOCC_FOCC016557 [Frankliniella occidentalis]